MEPSSLTQDEAHSARNQANSASNGADSALYETDSASETNDEEEYYHPLMTRREKQVHSRKEEYVELRLEEQLPEEQRNKQTVVGHLRRLSPHLGDSDPGEILWPIHRGVNLIGRSEEECSVVIQEEGISAVHALIEVLPSGVHHFVEDIGSTNGTHLGEGRDSLCPYRLYELAHNQIVSFNPVTFRYEKLNLEPRAVSVLSNVEPDSVESPPLKVSKSAPLPSRDAESEGELDEKTLTLVAEENSKADISDELCSNVSKPRTQTRPGPPLTHVKLEPGKAADMSQEIVDAQPNITAPLPHNAPSVEPMSGYCPERVSDSSAINHNSVSLQNSIPATQPLSMNVAPTLSIQQSLLLPPDISQIPHIDSQAGEHLSVIHEGGMGTIIQGHPPPFMTRAKSYTNSTPLNPFEQEEDLGEDVLSPQLGETNLTGDVMAEEVDDGDETEMEEDGEEDRRVTLRAFDPPFGDETTGKLIGGDTQVRKRASNPDVVPMSQTSQGSANLTRVTSRMDRHTDKLDINLKPQNEDLFVGEKGLGVAGDAMAVDLPVLPPPIARKDTNNESSLRTPVRVMSDLMPPTSSPAAASSPPPRFNVANSAAVHIQNRARDQSVNEEVNPKITPPAAADDTDDEEPLQKRRPSKAKSVADSSKSSSHKSSKEPGRGESTNGTLQIPASRPTPPSQQENSDPNNPMAIDTALPSSSPKRKRSPASTEVAPSLRASDEHAADAPVAMPASDDEEEEVAPRSRKRRAKSA
ncbi:hypothetical protein DFJ77DRAFT_188484 [Powellomyces hirtus]|nr:hypothetical protein DFJ77DRAFT_188484 [Powellomyces hirtus]